MTLKMKLLFLAAVALLRAAGAAQNSPSPLPTVAQDSPTPLPESDAGAARDGRDADSRAHKRASEASEKSGRSAARRRRRRHVAGMKIETTVPKSEPEIMSPLAERSECGTPLAVLAPPVRGGIVLVDAAGLLRFVLRVK